MFLKGSPLDGKEKVVLDGGVETLSFHSFRYTLTSIVSNAGVPVEVRQKFTGHASAEMNASYTHHEIETLRSAIGKLPMLRP